MRPHALIFCAHRAVALGGMMQTIKVAQMVDQSDRCADDPSEQRNDEAEGHCCVECDLMVRLRKDEYSRAHQRGDGAGKEEPFEHGGNHVTDKSEHALHRMTLPPCCLSKTQGGCDGLATASPRFDLTVARMQQFVEQ